MFLSVIFSFLYLLIRLMSTASIVHSFLFFFAYVFIYSMYFLFLSVAFSFVYLHSRFIRFICLLREWYRRAFFFVHVFIDSLCTLYEVFVYLFTRYSFFFSINLFDVQKI